jgi:hypothetical protein
MSVSTVILPSIRETAMHKSAAGEDLLFYPCSIGFRYIHICVF